MFVHGYLVNANIWRKLVPLLANRFRCITPDVAEDQPERTADLVTRMCN